MNNKILTVVLVAWIATTGFAGISAANSGTLDFGNKSEMRGLFEKAQSGETLTADEQVTLDSAKESRGERGAKFGWKRKGGWNLTDEEKTALESMTDDEKKAFFETKKEEMKAQKEAGKTVIDKLINGESLTADEEAMRLEMIAKMTEKSDSGKTKERSEVISKILAGDELTADEETQVVEMQAKHAEREAQRVIMEPIKAKLDAGEELTDEEQAILDDMKANKSQGKWNKGKRDQK